MASIQKLLKMCQEVANNHGFRDTWHRDPSLPKTPPEALMLIVAELGRAADAWRKNNREEYEHEIGDAIFRLFHHIMEMKIDIVQVLKELEIENRKRPYKHNRRI